jgi:hypothetical protein
LELLRRRLVVLPVRFGKAVALNRVEVSMPRCIRWDSAMARRGAASSNSR